MGLLPHLQAGKPATNRTRSGSTPCRASLRYCFGRCLTGVFYTDRRLFATLFRVLDGDPCAFLGGHVGVYAALLHTFAGVLSTLLHTCAGVLSTRLHTFAGVLGTLHDRLIRVLKRVFRTVIRLDD